MAVLFILAAAWLMIGSGCHGQLQTGSVNHQIGMLLASITLNKLFSVCVDYHAPSTMDAYFR